VIPYATEQRNKSDEQGARIDDQGIKSAELGTVDFVESFAGVRGQLRRPVPARSVSAMPCGDKVD